MMRHSTRSLLVDALQCYRTSNRYLIHGGHIQHHTVVLTSSLSFASSPYRLFSSSDGSPVDLVKVRAKRFLRGTGQIVADTDTASTVSSPLLICYQCSRHFPSTSQLNEHHLSVHVSKPHPCSYCDKSYKRRDDRVIHERIHHQHISPKRVYKPRIGNIHICPVCDYSSPSTYNLQRHVRTHVQQRPYACDLCLETFPTRWHVQRHKTRRHTDKEQEKQATQQRKKPKAKQNTQ